MNACMSEFRIVNPTLRTFSAAEARIAHSSIRFNNCLLYTSDAADE